MRCINREKPLLAGFYWNSSSAKGQLNLILEEFLALMLFLSSQNLFPQISVQEKVHKWTGGDDNKSLKDPFYKCNNFFNSQTGNKYMTKKIKRC